MSAQKRGYDPANQLAAALGVPRERVSDWVLNCAVPDASESVGLADYLGVPLSEVRTAQA